MKLAINGGSKVRKKLFPAYNTIGIEEEEAVLRVLRSGVLSKYLGVWHKDFLGGPEVQALEKEWADFFGVKFAVAVNSATSGLFVAMGASGVGPGDEVIVSPYTMSASVAAPIIYSAIPVFADIEDDYFCLDPEEVEKKITKSTRAIIVVDIFGQPYDGDEINKIARKHNLIVIEDCAQAPGAKLNGIYAGTLGDMGVYSLNFHKHIHAGEGGIIVTNSEKLADRCRLIRNHAESVVEKKGVIDLNNLFGFNLRMTELGAAIAREQLKKLPQLLRQRQENAQYLKPKLDKIPCLRVPDVRKGSQHSYYTQQILFDEEIAGMVRDKYLTAVRAELAPTELREDEGVMIGGGYVRPLYLLPIFQQRIAHGAKGHPWSCHDYKGTVDYSRGICPIAEDMHYKKLITHELMRPPMKKEDLDDVVRAFEKVWENRKELQ